MTFWMLQARCAELTAEQQRWFISDREDDLEAAVTICTACPVRIECLEYAARFERKRSAADRYGVYGGLLPDQRARAARTKTSAPPPPLKETA